MKKASLILIYTTFHFINMATGYATHNFLGDMPASASMITVTPNTPQEALYKSYKKSG